MGCSILSLEGSTQTGSGSVDRKRSARGVSGTAILDFVFLNSQSGDGNSSRSSSPKSLDGVLDTGTFAVSGFETFGFLMVAFPNNDWLDAVRFAWPFAVPSVDKLLFCLFVGAFAFATCVDVVVDVEAGCLLIEAARVNWLRPDALALGTALFLPGFGGFSKPSRQQKCLQLRNSVKALHHSGEVLHGFVFALVVASPISICKSNGFILLVLLSRSHISSPFRSRLAL